MQRDGPTHVAHALGVATVDEFSVVGQANSGTAILELITSATPSLLLDPLPQGPYSC